MFDRKEKEKELFAYHANFFSKNHIINYQFLVKTAFFSKGKSGRNIQLFEAELNKGLDSYVEIIDVQRDEKGIEKDLVSMYSDRPIFKLVANPYYAEEYELKTSTSARGNEYSAYIVPASELVCILKDGTEISFNEYENKRDELIKVNVKEQYKVDLFPDFEEEFIPKEKEITLKSSEDSIVEICKRISTDFEKLAIVLSKL